jgi:hypothetical protein
MTIQIHKPELETLIRQRRCIRSVEDVLMEALKSTPSRPVERKVRRNLADILSEPPFAGSNLNIERQKGRFDCGYRTRAV